MICEVAALQLVWVASTTKRDEVAALQIAERCFDTRTATGHITIGIEKNATQPWELKMKRVVVQHQATASSVLHEQPMKACNLRQ